jgi:hypothetical protein
MYRYIYQTIHSTMWAPQDRSLLGCSYNKQKFWPMDLSWSILVDCVLNQSIKLGVAHCMGFDCSVLWRGWLEKYVFLFTVIMVLSSWGCYQRTWVCPQLGSVYHYFFLIYTKVLNHWFGVFRTLCWKAYERIAGRLDMCQNVQLRDGDYSCTNHATIHGLAT